LSDLVQASLVLLRYILDDNLPFLEQLFVGFENSQEHGRCHVQNLIGFFSELLGRFLSLEIHFDDAPENSVLCIFVIRN